MATVEVPITHISEARSLRVVAVQLTSPFWRDRSGASELKFDREERIPIWDAQRRAMQRRTAKIRGVLDSLEELYGHEAFDIVAFPEYSVPREAHLDGQFQAYADSHRCILIPGTYIDDRPTELGTFRRNICCIYIPEHTAPVIIGKQTPTPGEGEYVEPYKGPNVARFVWTPPGHKAVSISVFICRDYLTPYSSATDDDPTDDRRRLEVDWNREGLHIALAHTEETRQFEAVAGLDLRNLRGRRKMTLLVNNAHCSRDLGCTLFGPAFNRERDDIVRSLPVDQETILSAEVRLWDVRAAVERPDRTFDEPIGSVREHPVPPQAGSDAEQPSVESVRRHLIVPGVDGSFALATIEEEINASFRGIWRTAFLAAEGLGLSMEFYKAQKLNKAVNIVRQEVQDAYAGVVRGEHDLLVRRYPRLEEIEGLGGPDFLRRLDGPTRRQLLDTFVRGDGGVMKVAIHAHEIWKYRGRCVIDEDFDSRRRELADKLQYRSAQRRQNLIAQILQYAEACSEHSRPTFDLKPFFYDEEPEKIIAVRPFTELRETYIFLDVQENGRRGSLRFERDVLKGSLMRDDRVREIFKITFCRPDTFNYLIKLKCQSHEADELGGEIRRWVEEQDVDCGMRTVDVMEYLCRKSVPGIETASQAKALRDFVEKLKSSALDEDDRIITKLVGSKMASDQNVVMGCARAWHDCHAAADSDETRAIWPEILSFFGSVLLFSAKPEEKYFVKAKDAWLHIYQAVEGNARQEMRKLHVRAFGYDVQDEFTRNDALKDKFYPQWKSDQWIKQREHTIRVSQRILQEIHKGQKYEVALKSSARELEEQIREARNAFVHNKDPDHARDMMNLSKGGDVKIDRLAQSVGAMVRAIDLILEATKAASAAVNAK